MADAEPLESSIWTVTDFDGVHVGTVTAATSADAEDQVRTKHPTLKAFRLELCPTWHQHYAAVYGTWTL